MADAYRRKNILQCPLKW